MNLFRVGEPVTYETKSVLLWELKEKNCSSQLLEVSPFF